MPLIPALGIYTIERLCLKNKHSDQDSIKHVSTMTDTLTLEQNKQASKKYACKDLIGQMALQTRG